jgi:threonyl-tRNA synthetase
MAQAIKRLYPNAKIAIGPVIEDGFYYDVDYHRPFTPEDLQAIEAEMRKIQKEGIPVRREEVEKEEAIHLFRERKEDYKLEILREIPEEQVSLYRQGEFVDLCRGPHVPSTSFLKHFKLLSVAGAYWRGDERNPMLQRIYGTAFPDEDSLQEYLHRLEEIKRRDHRRLGKDLDLFSIHEEIGGGLILWHPRGAILRELIIEELKQRLMAQGYLFVSTPHLAQERLWEISGHLSHYAENMYPAIELEGVRYRVKPMNCPFHIQIYHSRHHSYRDLPLRLAEFGTVYRFERGGVLHGLLRVRGFTQDDAHIFCTPDQVEGEVKGILSMVEEIFNLFGFQERETYLSTQAEKHIEDPERSQKATQSLKSALQSLGIEYQVDPGEGAFYGPKIDIVVRDSLKRRWQLSTIQVDFTLPRRFGLRYAEKEGEGAPVMIHRAILGSLERFIGILIEHYGGLFPLWLSPEQVRVLPVNSQHQGYAEGVFHHLITAGIRAHLDSRNETLARRIREAELEKIPIILVLGKREEEEKKITVRSRLYGEVKGKNLEEFLGWLKEEVKRSRCPSN